MLPSKKPVSHPETEEEKKAHRARLDRSLSDPIDEQANVPGYPGYRTRPGHSGLDPVEAGLEGGHVMGVFLRDVLTFQVRPRSTGGRLALLLAGAVFFAPLGLALYESITSGAPDFELLIVTALPGLLGVYLWGNLSMSWKRKR